MTEDNKDVGLTEYDLRLRRNELKIERLVLTENYQALAEILMDHSNYYVIEIVRTKMWEKNQERYGVFERLYQYIANNERLRDKVIPQLILAFGTGVGRIESQVARIVLRHMESVTTPYLEAALDNENKNIVLDSLSILLRVEGVTQKYLKRIHELLDDPDNANFIANVLADLDPKKHTEQSARLLLGFILTGNVRVMNENAQRTLVKFGLIDEFLAGSVASNDSQINESVVRIISDLDAESAHTKLLGLMTNKNHAIRAGAINHYRKRFSGTLPDGNNSEVITAMILALADKYDGVRIAALRLLKKHETELPIGMHEAAHGAGDSDFGVVMFLCRIGDRKHSIAKEWGEYTATIISMLIDALCLGTTENEENIRKSAAGVLATLPATQRNAIAKKLIEKLAEPIYVVGVSEAIARMGRETVSEFILALENKPQATKRAALHAVVNSWNALNTNEWGRKVVASAGLSNIKKVMELYVKNRDDLDLILLERTKTLLSGLYRDVYTRINRRSGVVSLGNGVLSQGLPPSPRNRTYRAESRRVFA